jgi:Flp pilus assembly protein TadD
VDLPLAHTAAASVAVARRQFSRAEQHIHRLLELEPEDAGPLLLQAHLLSLKGKRKEQREALERALALAPDDPHVLTDLGEEALERGELMEAEQQAREALAMDAQFLQALVLMGHVHLRRGQVEDARNHAIWALRQNATDPGALRLLVSVQARRSWTLGLWWRWATWMETLGDGKGMLVLLGAYAGQRVATQAAEDLQQPGLATLINLVWLALVAYSWVGPSLFKRMLQRELEGVRLHENF